MKTTLLMALTLDGKIAKDSDHFPDWTGKADKKLFMHLTQEAGVLVMGSKTFDTIGRPLPKRKNVILTRSVENYNKKYLKKFKQVDVNGKMQENLIFTDQSPQKILQDLEDDGFEEVILAGGAQINTLFAKENLIDEVKLTISPLIFGSGISLFTSEIDLKLELQSVELLDENLILVHYKVKKTLKK